jgi:hypothetical protein
MPGMAGRGLALAVAVAAVLAGCSGNGGTGSKVKLGNGQTVALQEVTNSQAGAGAISGVVVDDAIRPLASVHVILGGGLNRTANTTADGLFTFSDLQPGLYFLRIDAFADKATSKRYQPVQTTAEVAAGETAKVRIVVLLDSSRVPYHGATMKFDGFFQAASGFADEVLDLAVWNHTYGGQTLPNGCTCHFDFALDQNANLTTVVLELTWDEAVTHPPETHPLGGGWTMNFVDSEGQGPLQFCESEAANPYTSPCIIYANSDGNFSKDGGNYSIGVWSDASWAYAQEKFTLYVTPFYLAAPPVDWSFIAGDN